MKYHRLKLYFMETLNSQVNIIVKNVSTIVIFNKDEEFTMCGEIVNGRLDFNSIDCAHYEIKRFSKLSNLDENSIKVVAFEELKKFC